VIVEWPTDDRFRRFAALIADVVTQALAAGVRIGDSKARLAPLECSCPLGCIRRTSSIWFGLTHPGSGAAAHYVAERLGGLPYAWRAEVSAFISGFDDYCMPADAPQAYIELGRAYRRRFVEVKP
jgi:hypothetical protein